MGLFTAWCELCLRDGWRWNEFHNQARSLLHIGKLGRIEVPAVATSVQEHPAMIGFSTDPQLNCVGHVEDDFRGIGSDLSEGEGVFVAAGFEAICGDAGHEA